MELDIWMVGHSGRWPWGSGKDPYQSSPIDFLSRIEELKVKVGNQLKII